MAPADACPVCRLYERTAVAAALLEDLVAPAMAEHAIPAGLGGTIPLAGERVREALALLGPVSQMTGWDLGMLRVCLDQCAVALGGWLVPAGVSVVSGMLKDCRSQAYRVATAFYAGQ